MQLRSLAGFAADLARTAGRETGRRSNASAASIPNRSEWHFRSSDLGREIAGEIGPIAAPAPRRLPGEPAGARRLPASRPIRAASSWSRRNRAGITSMISSTDGLERPGAWGHHNAPRCQATITRSCSGRPSCGLPRSWPARSSDTNRPWKRAPFDESHAVPAPVLAEHRDSLGDRRGGRRRDRHRADRADPARAGARAVGRGHPGLGVLRALRGVGLGAGDRPDRDGQGRTRGDRKAQPAPCPSYSGAALAGVRGDRQLGTAVGSDR